MGDDIYRYRAIRKALNDLYPREPRGNLVRHLNVLAALISGIVGSKRTNLPAVAEKVTDGTKRESRVKRYSRWLANEGISGTTLQATVEGYGWYYVCRTAKNTILCEEGEGFAFEELDIQPGELISLPEVTFTRQAYGPVHAIAWWEKGYKEPLYLVTNLELAEEACYWYTKRFRIETFFSDQKSRGFNLHKSHLSDPARLARLMIAACLAYIWVVYLGVLAKRDGWVKIIHRTDLSLFQLGLSLLEHCLNERLLIPVAFKMPHLAESIR